MDAATCTPDSLLNPSLATLAEPVWAATQQQRRAKFHGWFACPTRTAPYGADDPDGTQAHERCRSLGCLDLHHDLIIRVMEKLRRLDPANARAVDDVVAYVYRVASTELVELDRSRRSARGFPAKPTRSDGVPGRINATLAACPDGPWLITLFRIMRSYPFSPHHVPGRWPLLGLAQEKSAAHGGRNVPVDEIRHDVRLVLTLARNTAGPEWVYANLTLPLMANGPALEIPHEHACVGTDQLDSAMASVLRAAYQRHRQAGRAPHAALTAAAREVCGREVARVTPEVREAIVDLESSLAPTTARRSRSELRVGWVGVPPSTSTQPIRGSLSRATAR